MNARCGEERIRAIDIVNDVLKDFKGTKIWQFSDYCKLTDGILREPYGGTNMGRAFVTLKNNNIKEFILLTDGQPDSETDALFNAKGLKIDIIYIGPQPTPQFLIDLAKMTNGNFTSIELFKLGNVGGKELENKIKGFLNA